MDLFELKKHIQGRMIRNFYVFAGEETGIMKIYVDQIAKTINLPIERLDTVQSVYQRTHRASLVRSSTLFVVQDDKGFMKDEKLWGKMSQILKGNYLVLIYTKLDKRSKFFKQMDYVPFNPMTPEVLAKYIIKATPISEPSARGLAEICECSYNRCLQEADKINTYISYRESIGDSITPDMAYRLLVNEGAIHKPIGDITFEVVDAIMDRNSLPEIERCLKNVKAKSEPRLLLLSLLYNNFRNLLMCQTTGPDNPDIQALTGLTAFELNASKRRVGRYSNGELLRAMSLLQELEYGVKTGTVEEAFSLDYFIAQVI